MAAEEESPRGRILLGVGALVGAILAGVSAFPDGGGDDLGLPDGAVATVNGVPISQQRYELALAALAADRRDPLSEDDRRRALDTLIDEELLVQRGLEIGLPASDPGVRSSLTAAMILWAGRDREAPSDEASLRAYYNDNRAYFARPGRLRVRRMFFRSRGADDQPGVRALRARRMLRDKDWDIVRAELADSPIAPVPDAALPLTTLREYLGPTLTQLAQGLPVGEVSQALPGPGGVHLIEVLEARETVVPPFEEVREEVAFDHRRHHDEAALKAYIETLRASATLIHRAP